ncbi:MAG: hypothetical protein GY757_17280 [bacterium]|nr:hypothetical protein [bacterium]
MRKHFSKAILCLTVVSLFCLCCHETPKSYYPTLEDAKTVGAIKRGWIPPVLPVSAADIHEQHSIDTNTVWIKFNANHPDLKKLSTQLRVLTSQEIDSLFPLKHPSGNWWVPTKKTRDSFSITAYDYKFNIADGSVETKTGYFFLDFENKVAYYYKP